MWLCCAANQLLLSAGMHSAGIVASARTYLHVFAGRHALQFKRIFHEMINVSVAKITLNRSRTERPATFNYTSTTLGALRSHA